MTFDFLGTLFDKGIWGYIHYHPCLRSSKFGFVCRTRHMLGLSSRHLDSLEFVFFIHIKPERCSSGQMHLPPNLDWIGFYSNKDFLTKSYHYHSPIDTNIPYNLAQDIKIDLQLNLPAFPKRLEQMLVKSNQNFLIQ